MADGGYDDSDRWERRGSDRMLKLILREVATQSLRLDQLEDALQVSTAVGRARKRKAGLLAERKAAEAERDAEVLEQLQAIAARDEADLIRLVQEDDDALDAAEGSDG